MPIKMGSNPPSAFSNTSLLHLGLLDLGDSLRVNHHKILFDSGEKTMNKNMFFFVFLQQLILQIAEIFSVSNLTFVTFFPQYDAFFMFV